MEGIPVTYGKQPNKCEILCRKDTVTQYRQGKIGRNKVLLSDKIYKDLQKGEEAPQSLIQRVFGHTDTDSAIETVLSQGDFNMSTNELRALKELAHQGVVAYIKRNYQNPTGNREYTEGTIESALDNCKVRGQIDYRADAETNFNKIKKKLLGKFPMKPKPGSIPYSVEVTWQQHAKLYAQYKPFITTETPTDDGTGCVLEMLVPSKDMDRIVALGNQ